MEANATQFQVLYARHLTESIVNLELIVSQRIDRHVIKMLEGFVIIQIS
jgi:hypothetical protein